EDLHKDLNARWNHILIKGLDKEVRSELCKQYIPPQNCGNIRAPKLNPVIQHFLSDVNKKKEVFNENKQNQLSSCLSALGQALNKILSSREIQIPLDIAKPLGDAETANNQLEDRDNIEGSISLPSRIVECEEEQWARSGYETIASISKVPNIQLSGRLRLFYEKWADISNDNVVLSWILGYKIPFKDRPVQQYIPRSLRSINIDTEWELADYAFEKIINSFGTPEFDLFASVQNTKCPRFSSWKRDPDAEKIDAFTFSWKDINFYAFPPFSLIPKVLQKILSDRAQGIVVVPLFEP
ncbi:jg4303, partial [Pararge aegeria aegeria]